MKLKPPEIPKQLSIPRCWLCKCNALEVKRLRGKVALKCYACGAAAEMNQVDIDAGQERKKNPPPRVRLSSMAGHHMRLDVDDLREG